MNTPKAILFGFMAIALAILAVGLSTHGQAQPVDLRPVAVRENMFVLLKPDGGYHRTCTFDSQQASAPLSCDY